MRALGVAGLVVVVGLNLAACGDTAGPSCGNMQLAITAPPAESRFTVHQPVAFSSTGVIANCGGTLSWYESGELLVRDDETPTFSDLPVGHVLVQVEFVASSRILGSDQRNIWVLLGRELLYDQQETELWRTDGEYNVLVTSNGGNPAWSPDRNRIAFVRFDGNDDELYLVNRDGGNLVQLTDNSTDDYAPAWSPDGTRLAFVSVAPGNPEIFLLTLATQALTRLTTNNFDDSEPDWKGNLIAYQANPSGGDYEIFTLRDDLTQNPVQLTANALDDTGPRWSPDGSKLVFSRGVAGAQRDVWVMGASGATPVNLTNHVADDREPEFSPDGSLIAFVSDRAGADRVWIMKSDGSLPVKLLPAPNFSGHPRWRP